MLQQTQNFPYVFIVDSPSDDDIFNNRTIGMALKQTLESIQIPCTYVQVSSKITFEKAFKETLFNSITFYQKQISEVKFDTNANNLYSINGNPQPIIHLCMHGNMSGISFTNNEFMYWHELRNLLFLHNQIKGYNPSVCMASCEGLNAASLINQNDSVFNFLIGNINPIFQRDLTVAYLAFYNHMFTISNPSLEEAVHKMNSSIANI